MNQHGVLSLDCAWAKNEKQKEVCEKS